MALIKPSSQLNEIIAREPSVIQVMNRFGIFLGIGDSTIEAICADKKLDTDFFVTILNTFTNEDYFPEKHLRSINPLVIVDYLRLTDGSYLQFQLPNIERHFASLLQHSGTANNLRLMKTFFNEVKNDVTAFINNDIDSWFDNIDNWSVANRDDRVHDDGKAIEEKISDLRNMMIMHLQGEYDPNLCYAVIVAIIAFEKDFRQNNRIRNRILLPLCDNQLNAQRSM